MRDSQWVLTRGTVLWGVPGKLYTFKGIFFLSAFSTPTWTPYVKLCKLAGSILTSLLHDLQHNKWRLLHYRFWKQQLPMLLTSTNQCSLTSLLFLTCCKSTDSGVGAIKVPQNVVLRTITVQGSCGTNAIRQEVLRAKFLELCNGSHGPKTPERNTGQTLGNQVYFLKIWKNFQCNKNLLYICHTVPN